jgi:HNH endonuclease
MRAIRPPNRIVPARKHPCRVATKRCGNETGFLRCLRCTARPAQHHIVPRSRNGSDDESNLITLCRDCHSALHELRSDGSYSHSQLTADGIAKARAVRTDRWPLWLRRFASALAVLLSAALVQSVAEWLYYVHPELLLLFAFWALCWLVGRLLCRSSVLFAAFCGAFAYFRWHRRW